MKTIYVLVASAKKIENLKIIDKKLSNYFKLYYIFTPNALKIFPKEVNALPKNKVVTDFRQMRLPKEDLILFYPCTFNSINKIYCGLADNLPLSLFFASCAHKIIVPSMNRHYWEQISPEKKVYLSQKYQFIEPIIQAGHIDACDNNKIIDLIFLRFRKYKDMALKPDFGIITPKVIFIEYAKIKSLLSKYIYAEDSSGTIALRNNFNTYISSSGHNIFKLDKNTIGPIKCNLSKKEICYNAKYLMPSVESLFISKFLSTHKNVNYLIHFHDPDVTYEEKYNKYKSKQYIPYGVTLIPKSIELIYKKYGFFIIKEHGIFMPLTKLSDLNKLMKVIYSECHE